MSNSFVQIAYVELPASEDSVDLELTDTVGTGDLLLFAISYGDSATVSSISDNKGNDWNLVFSEDNPTGSFAVALYYAYANGSYDDLLVTCDLSTTTSIKAAALIDYSGPNAPSGDSVGEANSSPNNAIAAGSVTAVAGNLLVVIGATQSSADFTPDSGYTLRTPSGAGNHIAVMDNLDTGAGSISPGISLGAIDYWVGISALFGALKPPVTIAQSASQTVIPNYRILPIEKQN